MLQLNPTAVQISPIFPMASLQRGQANAFGIIENRTKNTELSRSKHFDCSLVLSSVFLILMLTILHPIKHQINRHAGHRHIKPNGKRDLGEPYMAVKTAPERLRK